MFDGLEAELRYIVRVLRRSPGFTAVAILSLAIGIGANVSVFSVVRTLLLQPLPVEAPDELRLVGWDREGDFSISQNGSTNYVDDDTGQNYRSNYSYPIYRALVEAAPPGTDVFAFAFLRGVSVAVGDRPAFLAGGALADGRYFSSLGVPMALGRPLTEADDAPGQPLVAVLSHAFWMKAFGGDPDVLGTTLRLNGSPTEVVGVTGEGFIGMSMGGFFPQTEVTVPLSAQPQVYPRLSSAASLFTSDDVFWLRVMARVRAGTSIGDAEQALERAARAHPSPLSVADGHVIEVRLLDGAHGAQPVRAETGRLLLLLQAVVGIILLIACLNLTSLMLARGVARQREMAVRRALGGGRARLARTALLESLVLGGIGTAVGVALSFGTRSQLGDLLSGSLGSGAFGDLVMGVEIDATLIAASALLGMTATVLCGLAPALRLSEVDPITWLKNRTTGSAAPRQTVGRVLIALQIAVSVPLVVGAGLFLRTVSNLGAVELGFDPDGLASFAVDPGYTTLDEDEYDDLYLALLSSVERIPGVTSVTLLENALMSGIVSNGSVEVDGETRMVHRNAIGPAYRETLGVELIAGRMPGIQDVRGAERVGVVNQTAVRELYGGSSPIGRTIGSSGDEVRIVGVVGDTPYRNQRDPVPATLYESALQRDGYGGHNIVVRSEIPLARLEPLIRDAVYQVDPDVPVPTIRSQVEIMEQTSARERVFTQMLTLFGAFALLLATIGLHGVTSYAVARRTSEIGVRVAVGARPGQILASVLRRVVGLALIGVAIGIPIALATGPLVASLLFGVAPTDPFAVAGAALAMLVVAAGAGLVPAVRAARLDVLEALQSE